MKHALRVTLIGAVLALLLLLVPRGAAAAQAERFGDYIVYYSALATDQLPPEVAKTYGFVRSSHRGLLNIAVKRGAVDATAVAVAAAVSGSATNLANQRTTVDFREIRDGDAIYYLGEFPVSGTDTMRFELKVTPAGGPPHALRFSKNYVTD
ncbi:MAG: DUF4426 domain-containing protein [Mizugakiibacter sp.]|uniref:DUF4426 domain-containing protein n=1 Tax=Mizugakiibacter sp. TaxID=1972610 RepID=UPI0031C666F2|nr:DUF4426 domain-containing protein [Xanthomonadaceae bacterium]